MATVRAPKHTKRFLYLHKTLLDNGGYSNKLCRTDEDNGYQVTGVILVGYCPDTLAYFNALYHHAKRSFRKLTQDSATCGKVTKSPSVQGFTLLLFNATEFLRGWEPEVLKTYDNWTQYKPYKAVDGKLWTIEKNIQFSY